MSLRPEYMMGYVRIVDLILQYFAQLKSVGGKACFLQTCQYPGYSHVIVEGGCQSFVKALLIVGFPRTNKLPCCPAFQFETVKGKHHLIGFDISIVDEGIGPKLFSFFFGQRTSVAVKSRLEGIGKDPLYEGVIPFQFLVVVSPLFVHPVNELTVGL